MLILIALASLSIASDPDGVVSTAPRGADSVVVGAVAPTAEARPDASLIAPTSQSLTTAQQIDRWVAARSGSDAPFAQDRGPIDDRKMHGFVTGAIGTGDYNSVVVGVSVPVGESGRLDLTYSRSENGYAAYGYGYPGYGYGYGSYEFDPLYGAGDRLYPAHGSRRWWAPTARGDGQTLSLSYESEADDREPFDGR